VSARKHLPGGLVTFLFTDIEGSTRWAQMLGGTYRSVLTDHRDVLRTALSTGDATELFTEGDSLFVAFDNAAAALSACVAAQRALAGHRWPDVRAKPLVRMGLHTGWAEPSAGEYASPEVHRAARVAAAAHGGQVLCTDATARYGGALDDDVALLDLGLHRLRGFDGRERLYQLVAPGLARDFPLPRTLGRAAHNLPTPVTSFVGRAAERARLTSQLRANRLVTLVGTGGVGKTRLAVEVALGLVDRYPDGVWFVDLAGVTEPAGAGPAVAAALGVRPEPGRPLVDTIADLAGNRELLLLVDTCDAHLSEAGTLVTRLLGAGSAARVLATSREPLGRPGELVTRLPALPVHTGVGGLPGDAVALLVDRAVAARGGRPVVADELARLGEVAAAVGGNPLALELAAARLRILSAGQLAGRLDDVLGTLDAGRQEPTDPCDRHRTIAATVDWSVRTLDPATARLLRRLSVFVGSVGLAEIEAINGGDPLHPVAALVDKSLVQAEPRPDGSRYRLVDPVRSYAARALVRAGEETVARDQHVAWCLGRLATAGTGPDGRPAPLALYALDPIADELRAALRWTATGGDVRAGLAVVAGLDQWWRERGLAGEARDWLNRLYPRADAVPDGELAVAYRVHAAQAGATGDYADELRYCARAEYTARRANDPGLLANVLAGRGAALLDLGRVADAERACRESIAWARCAVVSADALAAVYTLAQMLWRRGALDEAADLLANARQLEASRPAERGRRTVDMLLGLVALARGDVVAAHDHLVVALRSRMTHGFHAAACQTLNAMAVRCAAGGDPRTAAGLFGAAQAARSRLAVPSSGALGGYWRERQAAVRDVLGDEAFDRAYAEGGTLTLDDAVVVALAVEHPDLVGTTSGKSWPQHGLETTTSP
jgi:predicted ATPase/class 3 adenylate cyclase